MGSMDLYAIEASLLSKLNAIQELFFGFFDVMQIHCLGNRILTVQSSNWLSSIEGRRANRL